MPINRKKWYAKWYVMTCIGIDMAKIKADTARGITALLKKGDKGLYSAGSGLYLQVNGEGVGSWIYRYQLNGKRRKLGLGSASIITLAEARKLALEARLLVDQNIDPVNNKQQLEAQGKAESTQTFNALASEYIEAHKSEWKNEKSANQWTNTLKTYASPVIGNLLPKEITTAHILQILQPIWETKNETANRIRGRIEKILNLAKVRGLREGENPAQWRGNLEFNLSKRSKRKKKHYPALPYTQLPAFWQELIKDNGTSAQALQFKILTLARTSTILQAEWKEIDLKARVWTIPAHKMKKEIEHRIPLSNEAMALLERIPRTDSPYLFEGRKKGTHLSNMTMRMKMRRMDEANLEAGGKGYKDAKTGETATPHGFRSTFKDYTTAVLEIEDIVTKRALAHKLNEAETAEAYQRSDLLERRRPIMERWAHYVTGKEVKIIPFSDMA